MTSPVFDWLCTELAQRTGLEAVQVRGMLRFVLQNAGLEPRTFDKIEAQVVVDRLLPRELGARRVANAPALCGAIAQSLRAMTFASSAPESAESAFARLGRK